MTINVETLNLDQLKNLIANHERLGATEKPLYGEAKAELQRRKANPVRRHSHT